ncbi:MAG: hypothetical protein Q9221_003554 [Calogaya cf. arnoldii]
MPHWIHNGSDHLDAISDYRTILGLCAIVYAGLCIGQSRWGLGLPLGLRPDANINQYSVINFAGRPIYMFGILGFKIALCWAYLRILKASPNPRYKILIYTVMGGAIIGHVAGTFVLIFQCSPPQKSWQPKTFGKCLDNDATFYGLAAVTIFFDIVIFFLPIPLLMKLNINNKKKIALICVFMLGLLTTVCSIMRMVQIITIANTGNSTMLVLWGVIELNVGIILTCIPTLGPLFPSLTGGTSRTNPSSHNPSSYQLSALRAHKGTALQSGNTKTQPNGSNGSSSQEEILGLKASEAALYGIGMGMRDDDILKTTEVRVSIDDPERATTSGGRMQTASAW